MLKNNCCDTHNKALFTLSENKSRVIFSNKENVEINCYKIDGCCIVDGERCDYLINIESLSMSFLIELKGCDIKKAISQLYTTSNYLKSDLKSTVYWIISSTRCPMSSSEVQIEKIKALKKGYRLLVKNSPVQQAI